MKRSALNLAWVMLGILVISATLITLGKRESAMDPRIDSYGPSGLSLFAELLKANGYRVESTSYPLPNLQKGDIPVICMDQSRFQTIDYEAGGVLRVLSNFIQGGGHAVILPLGPGFNEASMQQVTVQNSLTKAQVTVSMRKLIAEDNVDNFLPEHVTSAPIWEGDADLVDGVASLTRDGSGTIASVADGYMACNRHIDQAQNANILMSMVRTIAPPGSRFVFTEATYSGSQPGLIDLLGPGAAGIWYQSLFLFIVIVFTLGIRFGLPEETRPPQTGQRELVEAIADTYRRACATKVACRSAYDRADLEVRKALKLSTDAPASERDLRIPPELSAEFRRVFEGTIDSESAQEAFSRCQALRRQVRAFLKRG